MLQCGWPFWRVLLYFATKLHNFAKLRTLFSTVLINFPTFKNWNNRDMYNYTVL